MRRVASLLLPHLAIERLRRPVPPHAPPERRFAHALPVNDDPGLCSAPKGGGWRPGAGWAKTARSQVAVDIQAMPAHQRPPGRELGRRSEAAGHPFKAMRADDAGAPSTLIQSPIATPGARPLVLASIAGRAQVVTATCLQARALGIEVGTALTYARALIPELEVLPADPEGDQAWLTKLARHAAKHWTPHAVVEADGLVLDMTGCTHLFGGEDKFCARVIAFLERAGYSARIAIAATPGAAHAVARYGAGPSEAVAAEATVQAIAGLPVAALRLEPDALAACRRFGIERIADLLPLPRGPLARRVGRRAVERLDQALGRVAEPLTPIVIEAPPAAKRRLLEPIGTAEAIGQVMADLAGDLVERLRERGLGARSLGLTLLRVDGDEQRLALGMSSACRDPAHIARLLQMRIDRIDPGLGIEAGFLTATLTEPLGAVSFVSVLAGEGRHPDISQTVDQLAGRVGADAIFRASLVESDVPERAVQTVSALSPVAGWPKWRRPVRLLRRPEPLLSVMALLPDHPPRRFAWRGHTHVITAGDGPERIHGEWWTREGETWAVRDYFRVEDGDGGRYWIFRRGDGVDPATGDVSWWMHGAFG